MLGKEGKQGGVLFSEMDLAIEVRRPWALALALPSIHFIQHTVNARHSVYASRGGQENGLENV